MKKCTHVYVNTHKCIYVRNSKNILIMVSVPSCTCCLPTRNLSRFSPLDTLYHLQIISPNTLYYFLCLCLKFSLIPCSTLPLTSTLNFSAELIIKSARVLFSSLDLPTKGLCLKKKKKTLAQCQT